MNDRRHELQQNELAAYLARLNTSIEPYSRMILAAVCVLIVAAIGWGIYSTRQSENRSDATMQLLQAAGAGDPEVLAQVSDLYPGTVAGNWARMYQGNEYLAQGINALYSDRENAVQLLGDARNAFANALAGASDPLLMSRAHFGLARVAESLGELDQAIEEYQATIAIGESEAMIEKAEARIESLNDAETKQFLVWFADQDFAPPEPSMPPSMPGSETLPDMPDLELPPLDFTPDELSLDLEGSENSKLMENEEGMELPSDEQAESQEKDAADATASESETSKETIKLPEDAGQKPAGTSDKPAEVTEKVEAMDLPQEAKEEASEASEAADKVKEAVEKAAEPGSKEDVTPKDDGASDQ